MAKKLTKSKAKEILHDKSVHGHPLTDKQRRFFGAIAGGAKPYKAEDGGWLDKYVPKAQNGIEGTMGGLTDKGFNYNGAWGGPSMQMGGNIMPAMAGANQTVPMAQLGDSVKPIPMQLAMGGSLPGAVGFTYARTAGAAPANGPYAKKTKASAQNGQEMKFYQAGLDFTPKTISKNGGWLDKFDTPQAQDGDVLEYLKKTKSAPVVTKGKPLTAEQQKRITAETLNRQTQKNKPLTATNTRPIAEAKARKEQLDVVEKNKEADRRLQAERAAARKTREAVIGGDENATFTFPDGTTKSWKNMDWREQQYVSGKNLGSLNRGDWTDYINPLAMIGSMGEGLATSPYEAKRTNSILPYATGIGAPLLTGALGGIGTKGSTAKFVENVVNPTPISLSGGIKNIKNTPNVNDFSKYLTSEQVGKGYSLMRDVEGNLILRNDGKRVGNIELFGRSAKTDAKGNKWGAINIDINPSHRGKGLSKPLYEAVFEEAKNRGLKGIYSTDELLQSPQQSKAIRKYFPGKYSTDENILRKVNEAIDEDNAFAKELGQYDFTPRAKQVYLMGFQDEGQFVENIVSPILGELSNIGEYLTTQTPLRNAYKINPWAFKPKSTLNYRQVGQEGFEDLERTGLVRGAGENIITDPNKNLQQVLDYYSAIEKGTPNMYGAMNIKAPYFQRGNLFYDVNSPEAKYLIETTQSGTGVFSPAQSGFVFNGEGFYPSNAPGGIGVLNPSVFDRELANFNIYKRDWLRGYKPVKKENGGDVPVDPMGYWNPDNWGNPVIIPSTDITMEGVDVPLIGISDTGDVQYMEPGEDYEFDGEYVTEYPVAKKGISVNNADAQPLKKLDQLLNFTNYNKPTKGGWLDKYN